MTIETPQIDKNYISKHGLFYQLINAEKNEDLLRKVPYVRLLDLAAIYYTPISKTEDGNGIRSLILTNDICKKLGIDEEFIDESLGEHKFEANVITEFTGLKNIEYVPLYVITNEMKLNGAAVMLFPQYFNELAEKFDSDLYILPSSIHEVIVFPVNHPCYITEFDADNLRKMVSEINSTIVSEKDFLSNNVYYYDRKKKELSIA